MIQECGVTTGLHWAGEEKGITGKEDLMNVRSGREPLVRRQLCRRLAWLEGSAPIRSQWPTREEVSVSGCLQPLCLVFGPISFHDSQSQPPGEKPHGIKRLGMKQKGKPKASR